MDDLFIIEVLAITNIFLAIVLMYSFADKIRYSAYIFYLVTTLIWIIILIRLVHIGKLL